MNKREKRVDGEERKNGEREEREEIGLSITHCQHVQKGEKREERTLIITHSAISIQENGWMKWNERERSGLDGESDGNEAERSMNR